MDDLALPRWKDEIKIYPPFAVIAKAMNDPGERSEKTKNGKKVPCTKFAPVEKLASAPFSNIKDEFNPPGLTVNVSRGKQKLLQELVLSRKKVDVSETHTDFHKCAKDGMAFLIKDDNKTCGIEVCIDHFQNDYVSSQKKKNSARTGNDGLRLGCILLDPKCRSSVSGLVTKKKTKAKSDITGDPNLHFFEKILSEAFCNPDHCVSLPPMHEEFPEEEKGSWDPNDSNVIESERSGTWLKETWDTYLRKKCKKALDKWNKLTGGGDGTLPSFVNYCGSDTWLAWIFVLDFHANFLLANGAGGGMPGHLQLEAGFEDEVASDLTDASDGGSGSGGGSGAAGAIAASNKGKRKAELELVQAKLQRDDIKTTLDRVMNKLDRCDASENDIERNIQKVASYSIMMQDEKALRTMTPNTKNRCVDAIGKERSKTMEKL